MSGREAGDAVVHLFPHVGCHHEAERHVRQFEREVAPRVWLRVDDRAVAWRVSRAADQEARDRIDRLCVADSPIRGAHGPASASRRSSDNARWLPRFDDASV